MTQLARILLVEDNPNDLELTLEALSEYHLTNEVVVARDGQEAMDYLLRQGQFADRPLGNPAVVLLDLKLPKIDQDRCAVKGGAGGDHDRVSRGAGFGAGLHAWRKRLCGQAG